MIFSDVRFFKPVAAAILVLLSVHAIAQVQFSCDIKHGNDKGVLIYVSKAFTTDTLADFKLKNGKGSVVLEPEVSGYVLFKCDKQYTLLYLAPSGSIQMSTDYETFDSTMAYGGDQALLNNFLADERRTGYRIVADYHMQGDSFCDANNDWLNLLNQELEHLIVQHKGDKQVSDAFHKLCLARYRYEWALRKLRYPSYHLAYTGEEVETGDAYNEYIASLDLNDRTLLPLYYYREFLIQYLYSIARKDLPDKYTPAEALQANVRSMRNTISDEQVRNYVFTALINRHIQFNGIAAVDRLLAAYYETCTDSTYSDIIEKKVKKWEHLRPGMPAPTFSYPDIDGKVVSLEDLKGSYLYIDVWATWCGPCKGELPYLDTLETRMEGKNIRFVSVSLDDKKKVWKKMVTEKELKGTQLFANGWQTGITKQYNIVGIPRFILIDPEGKIVDACAPRPSGAAEKLISEQLDINPE